VLSAREVNGQEQPVGSATVVSGALTASFTPFAIRTFAVKLGPAPAAARGTELSRTSSQPVHLTYDLAAASRDSTPSVGGFDAQGRALPAEMLPATIPYGGATFVLPEAREGVNNAVTARGQTIALPPGYTRVYLLAASADGDQRVSVTVGNKASDITVQDWGGFVGQWYQRVMKRVEAPPPTPEEIAAAARQQARQDSIQRARMDSVRRVGGDTTAVAGRGGRGGGGRGGRGNQGPRMIMVLDSLNAAFTKDAPIAWFASHRHTAAGANEIYSYAYLFAYALDIPPGATTLSLPNNDRVRVMAISVTKEGGQVLPAQPLYDRLGRDGPH
jgi:alpha-mannosidase